MFKELLSVRASLKSGKADQALAELEAVLGPMALADLDSHRVSSVLAETANKSAQSMADLGRVLNVLQTPTAEAKRQFRAVSGCSQADIDGLDKLFEEGADWVAAVDLAKMGVSIDSIRSFYRQQKQASEAGEKLRKDLAQGLGSSGRFKVHSVLMGPNKTTVGFVGAGGGGGVSGCASGGSACLQNQVGGVSYAPFEEKGYKSKTIKGVTKELLAQIESAPEAVKGDPVIVNMKLARARLKKFAELNNCPSQEHAIQLMGFKNWMASPFINQLSLYQLTTPYGGHIATFLGADIIIGKGISLQARS